MARQANIYQLTVLSGPNAGARTRLAGGRLTIGGGESDQIILAGVAPGALALRLKSDTVRLRPTVNSIAHEDVDPETPPLLPVEVTQELPLPATLRLDEETSILLARVGALRQPQIGLHIGLAMAAIALTVGLWAGGKFGGPATPADAAPPAPASLAEAATSPAAKLVATSPRLICDAGCIENTAAEFAGQMKEAGLNGLHLSAENGVLRVTGSLPPERAENWRKLRESFESENGQSLPLIAQITEGQPEPALAIASVWLGPLPEVRTKAGNILHIGDETGDGWQISAITRGEVILSRDGEERQVRF